MVIYCTKCWKDNSAGSEICSRCGAKLEDDNKTFIDKLIRALSHPEPMTVERAAWILGELESPEAVVPLVRLLQTSRDMGTLEKAVEAVGKINDKSAVDVLASKSSEWPLFVRVRVVESLAKIGGPEAEKAIKAMLQDPSARVRKSAGEILQKT